MKKISLLLLSVILVGTSFLFNSCEGDDLGTVEVVLSNAKIDIPFTVKESEGPANVKAFANLSDSATALNYFSGVVEGLNIDDPMFNDLKDQNYSSLNLIVQKVTVQFIKNDSVPGIIKDFTTSATVEGEEEELGGYASKEQFDLFQVISEKQITDYIQSVFDAIQEGKTINIEASGLTDIAPSGLEEAGTIVVTPTVKAKMKLSK